MQCGECRLVPTWPVMISHADDFNSVTTSNPTLLSQHPSPVSASHVTIIRLNVLYFAWGTELHVLSPLCLHLICIVMMMSWWPVSVDQLKLLKLQLSDLVCMSRRLSMKWLALRVDLHGNTKINSFCNFRISYMPFIILKYHCITFCKKLLDFVRIRLEKNCQNETEFH